MLFVCGSITSYALAEKTGNFYADDIMKKLGIKKKQTSAEADKVQIDFSQKDNAEKAGKNSTAA